MSEESIRYCYMNKNFKFIDEYFNITDELKEAIGYETLEEAIESRKELDEPDEWKIVRKKIIFTLEEIYD